MSRVIVPYLDLVEDLCEDVVIIDHGKIVLAGEPPPTLPELFRRAVAA